MAYESVLFHVCVYVICREQDELTRLVQDSVSEQERRELQREQESLLLKMERKGEQISKLCKHKTQVSFSTKIIQLSHNQIVRLCFTFLTPFHYLFWSLDKEVKKESQFKA